MKLGRLFYKINRIRQIKTDGSANVYTIFFTTHLPIWLGLHANLLVPRTMNLRNWRLSPHRQLLSSCLTSYVKYQLLFVELSRLEESVPRLISLLDLLYTKQTPLLQAHKRKSKAMIRRLSKSFSTANRTRNCFSIVFPNSTRFTLKFLLPLQILPSEAQVFGTLNPVAL